MIQELPGSGTLINTTVYDIQGDYNPSGNYKSIPAFCDSFKPALNKENIYRKCREGELPYIKIGRRIFIDLDALKASE